MKPRVTLRQALDDPSLLGAALAGPSWHAWRSLLLAAMGEPLQPDELETFTRFTGRSTPPAQRVDELWCCVGRRGGKSRAMSTLAVYLAGLCDYSDMKALSPAKRLRIASISVCMSDLHNGRRAILPLSILQAEALTR